MDGDDDDDEMLLLSNQGPMQLSEKERVLLRFYQVSIIAVFLTFLQISYLIISSLHTIELEPNVYGMYYDRSFTPWEDDHLVYILVFVFPFGLLFLGIFPFVMTYQSTAVFGQTPDSHEKTYRIICWWIIINHFKT